MSTGMFVLSWFLIPLHMGAPFYIANQNLFGAFVFNEASGLMRDARKDRSTSVLMEWCIYLTFSFFYAPKYVFTKVVLYESGMPQSEYPMLHSILFDYRITICLVSCMVILIWFCLSLRRGGLRYQFSRFGFSVIMAFVIALNCVASQMFYQLGVFWVIFVPIVIACNDCWAYLTGITFGKTLLIKLSPNKTLEGFIGGAIATFIQIFTFTGTIFTYERFSCINHRINTLPFEQI